MTPARGQICQDSLIHFFSFLFQAIGTRRFQPKKFWERPDFDLEDFLTKRSDTFVVRVLCGQEWRIYHPLACARPGLRVVECVCRVREKIPWRWMGGRGIPAVDNGGKVAPLPLVVGTETPSDVGVMIEMLIPKGRPRGKGN